MKKPTSEVFLPSAEQGFGVTEFISGNSRHTLPPSGEGKFVGVPTLLHWLKTALENRFDDSPFNSFLLGSKGRGAVLAYAAIQQRHKRPYRSHKYAVNLLGRICRNSTYIFAVGLIIECICWLSNTAIAQSGQSKKDCRNIGFFKRGNDRLLKQADDLMIRGFVNNSLDRCNAQRPDWASSEQTPCVAM